MLVKMVSTSMAILTTSKPNPMQALTGLLVMTWILSSEMFNKNGSPWATLMILMAFNGGLMILYIFIISMAQQEKVKEKNNIKILVMAIIPIIMATKKSEKKSSNISSTIYSSSVQSILLMSTIMVMMLIPMMKMNMKLFKTMKSSKM